VTTWSSSKWNEFQFRKTSLAQISIPLIFSGGWFTSIAADVNSSSTSASGMFGSVYAGLQIAPTTTLAYFSAQFNYKNIQNYYSFDVSGSAGFMGAEYTSISEMSGSTVVSQKLLKNLIWTLGGSQNNGGLHYFSIRGTELFSSFEVIVTFISSDVVGEINYQGSPIDAIVTPKTIESIIEINNYPYKSSSNSLSLSISTATGNFQVVGSASASNLISGTDVSNQVYFALSKDAVINGNSQGVSISTFTQVSAGSSYIEGQAKGKYGGSFSSLTVTVSFPAGATHIVYDPTIGQGTPPTLDYISGVAVFFIVLACLIVVTIIVIVVVFLIRRNRNMKRPYVAYR